MPQQPMLNREAVERILPHRRPFLFVDRIVALEKGRSLVAERRLRSEEPFFGGHFPGNPVMPGVLVCEALAQACGILQGLADAERGAEAPGGYFLANVKVKFTATAYPGDTLRLETRRAKRFGALIMFDVAAYVGEREVARGTLSLAEQSLAKG
jgi:3-hydroxyacyl-[acyl-carrier-protein] dehydratase